MLRGFPPVLDARTALLILGSFPGEASLAAAQYYAHPRNQFWRLLGAVIGEPLAEQDYAVRLATVLRHRIGIWDIHASCEREGSLDASIRRAMPNDLASLRNRAPGLRRVCFNGKTAGRCEPAVRAAGYETLLLPSSSPAYAVLSFEQKLRHWRAILP